MTDTLKDKDLPALRVPHRQWSLMPQSLGEAKEIATLIANSDFAPKDYRGKPDNVIVALQMGADLGLKPMQALQNIAVINGRPSIYGDAALALAMDVLEKFEEKFTGTFPNDDFTAVCISRRKGWPSDTVREFSITDAKKAGLWGKQGPWQNYPKRMLQFRARGFNLRDIASDRLLGLILAEEAEDYPEVRTVEGSVVPSAPVQSAALTTFEQLPEGLRDRIEKGFAVMNFSNGQRITKLNEYFGGNGVSEESAESLLEWLRDEYSKRKTGQPVKRKPGRPKKETADAPAVLEAKAEPVVAPAPAADPSVPQSHAPAPVETPSGEALF